MEPGGPTKRVAGPGGRSGQLHLFRRRYSFARGCISAKSHIPPLPRARIPPARMLRHFGRRRCRRWGRRRNVDSAMSEPVNRRRRQQAWRGRPAKGGRAAARSLREPRPIPPLFAANYPLVLVRLTTASCAACLIAPKKLRRVGTGFSTGSPGLVFCSGWGASVMERDCSGSRPHRWQLHHRRRGSPPRYSDSPAASRACFRSGKTSQRISFPSRSVQR